MKNILFLYFLIFCVYVSAQNNLQPCGTVSFRSEWLKKYQNDPAAYNILTEADSVLKIPIKIHIVGSTDKLYKTQLPNVLAALCQLNIDFIPSKIKFFIEGDIDYIYNSAWYSHKTVLEGADMMLANNQKNVLNCYIVTTAAGNCGYNLPYAGVCIASGCLAGHTWAHEVGHALQLPHPFLGWEAKTYDPNNVTPTRVTYDYTNFKDSLIKDTVIIDTAFVELVDRSNCKIAADGFCDTECDYISQRWTCGTDMKSPNTMKDPNNIPFKADGTLIMSYSSDGCQVRFSPMQIDAMRAFTITEKKYKLQNIAFDKPITAIPKIISPISSTATQVPYSNAKLTWGSVPNATHYNLQLTVINDFFEELDKDIITKDTTWVFNDLKINRNYRWRVLPFNNTDHCGQLSDLGRFRSIIPLAINSIDGLRKMQLFPNPIKYGDNVNIEIQLEKGLNVTWSIFSIDGNLLSSKNTNLNQGINKFTLPTNTLAKGVYMVGIKNEDGIKYEKLIVQ